MRTVTVVEAGQAALRLSGQIEKSDAPPDYKDIRDDLIVLLRYLSQEAISHGNETTTPPEPT